MFERAEIYHLKVHISHKKVRQEAKSDHPLFRPANSCGLISFQARTLALLDLSRHATLLRVLLDETISFQDSDCSFLKKKNRFYSSIDGKEKPLLRFLTRYHRRPDCLNLLVFVQASFFFLLRLPPSFFAFPSLSLLRRRARLLTVYIFFSVNVVCELIYFTVLI